MNWTLVEASTPLLSQFRSTFYIRHTARQGYPRELTGLGVASIGEATGLRKLAKFAGGLVWFAAWIIAFWLGVSAICMCLGLLLELGSAPSPNDVPVPLLWDAGITAAIALAVALSVPRVGRASAKAFGRPGPFWRP